MILWIILASLLYASGTGAFFVAGCSDKGCSHRRVLRLSCSHLGVLESTIVLFWRCFWLGIRFQILGHKIRTACLSNAKNLLGALHLSLSFFLGRWYLSSFSLPLFLVFSLLCFVKGSQRSCCSPHQMSRLKDMLRRFFIRPRTYQLLGG